MKKIAWQAGTYVCRAYAKINTYLEVLGQREDGYHELCSHMQLITLCDTLETRIKLMPIAGEKTNTDDGPTITLQSDHPTLSCGEDNLILRAARLFFETVGLKNDHKIEIEFYLHKKIPMQGGLAGGSADAAAVLLSLNKLCGEPFALNDLCSMGVLLGADVPFCIRGRHGAQTATGIGEVMTPAAGISPNVTLLVALPGTAVSTPAAFRWLDERYCAEPIAARKREHQARYRRHLAALDTQDFRCLEQTSWNRFEEAVFSLQPQTKRVFDAVRMLGADMTRMSGSGPTIIGYFFDEERASTAQRLLQQDGIVSYLCHPLEKADE